MKIRDWLLAAALGFSAGAWAHPTVADPASYVTTQLSVSGAVEHPLTLGVADLRQFPQQQLEELPLVRQNGAKTGQLEHLKGVRLRDLLERAVVVSNDHVRWLKSVEIRKIVD